VILDSSSGWARSLLSSAPPFRHYGHLGIKNAIRPTALGKKNWLFFGSEEAGERSAEIYTLIANCRMHGVEPQEYLKDILERLPRATNQTVAELTPLAWKKAREKSLQHAA
jgi:transposase